MSREERRLQRFANLLVFGIAALILLWLYSR